MLNNVTITACYLPFVLVTASVLVSALLFERGKRLAPSMIFLSASLLCWLLVDIAYFTTNSEWISYLMYNLNLPFVGFTVLGVLQVVGRFYSLDRYLSRSVMTALGVLPMVTLLLSLTDSRHHFIRRHLEILSTTPYHVVSTVRAPWFWIHTAYCYLIMAATFFIVIAQHRKLPKSCRAPSRYMVGGILVALSGNALVLTNALNTNLDFSLIAGSIAVLLLFLATLNNQGLEVLVEARSRIFDQVDTAVTVFDGEGQLLNSNRAAREAIALLGIEIDAVTYDTLMAQMQQKATAENSHREQDGDLDFTFMAGDGELVYSFRPRPILDNRGRVIGRLLLGWDITDNARIIRSLEVNAGMDSLTGLSNRRKIELDKQALDRPDQLPLAVIEGDLNNLKVVNDTKGHLHGDLLLHEVANILIQCAPPGARIARTGGDEFLLLLPRTSLWQARQLMQDITIRAAQSDTRPAPSIALGCAVKENPRQNLEEVIRSADAAMYEDKARTKSTRTREYAPPRMKAFQPERIKTGGTAELGGCT